MNTAGYNIKIVEGNAFSLLFPLMRRTYVSNVPLDEDIVIEDLTDVVVKFGGVQYTAVADPRGLIINLPSDLARKTYDAIITAKYNGFNIQAAYFEAVTIVEWNFQSDAEQYIQGSPIAMRPAYVVGGVLSDAELEALKEEYREKNAQLDQAIADAEAAKREWEEKAADLDGVAQEATSQQILTAVENIDFSTLAKEATLGTPLVGQPSTIFAAIAAVSQSDDSKQTIVDAINHMGGSATTSMTWAQLAQQIENLVVLAPTTEFNADMPMPISIGRVLAMKSGIRKIVDNYSTVVDTASTSVNIFAVRSDIEHLEFTEALSIGRYFCYSCGSVKVVKVPKATAFGGDTMRNCGKLQMIDVSSSINFAGIAPEGSRDLIDIITGANFNGNASIPCLNPTNCYSTTSSSLCFDNDLNIYGRTFANNFEKWKWCIINHFAANLPDRTGLTTYTISQGTQSAYLSHFDAEMIAAFTDKNWNLA